MTGSILGNPEFSGSWQSRFVRRTALSRRLVLMRIKYLNDNNLNS